MGILSRCYVCHFAKNQAKPNQPGMVYNMSSLKYVQSKICFGTVSRICINNATKKILSKLFLEYFLRSKLVHEDLFICKDFFFYFAEVKIFLL